MAAADSFENYNKSLSDEDRAMLNDLTRTRRLELLAARSEEARVRLVEEYIREVNDLLRKSKA